MTAGLTNNAIKKAVDQALSQAELDAEFLPLDMRKKYNLVLHKKALQDIHFPSKEADFFAARNVWFSRSSFYLRWPMHRETKSSSKTIRLYTASGGLKYLHC